MINLILDGMNVSGDAIFRDSDITHFGNHVTVGGTADFTNCRQLSSLGENNKFGVLTLTGCTALKSWPEKITVGRVILPDGSIANNADAAKRWFQDKGSKPQPRP